MIAFDTNFLVRHLIQDDPKQCAIVAATIESEADEGRGIMLYDVVLCETLWVLDSAYQANRDDLLVALKALQDEPVFVFENPERVAVASKRFETGRADFSDYLILEIGNEKGNELKTFDKKLMKET
ncbi:MAG: type II toxin-antitoxin system VapC family toxin [Opitutales bacterium]